FEKYSRWATEKFLAIPAFRAVAGDFNTMVSYYPGAEVSYDPGTNRVSVVLPEDVRRDNLFQATEADSFRRGINALNKSLSVLDPIFEAGNTDVQEMLPQLLRQLNVEFEGGNSDGFFQKVSDAIQSGAQVEGEEV